MQFIIYILIVFLSLFMAWQLGNTAHGSASNLLVFLVIISGAHYFLSRRICLSLSAMALFLGVVAPAGVWTYGECCIQGDSSGYGMLGTILAFVFVPIGLGLAFIGWIKGR